MEAGTSRDTEDRWQSDHTVHRTVSSSHHRTSGTIAADRKAASTIRPCVLAEPEAFRPRVIFLRRLRSAAANRHRDLHGWCNDPRTRHLERQRPSTLVHGLASVCHARRPHGGLLLLHDSYALYSLLLSSRRPSTCRPRMNCARCSSRSPDGRRLAPGQAIAGAIDGAVSDASRRRGRIAATDNVVHLNFMA